MKKIKKVFVSDEQVVLTGLSGKAELILLAMKMGGITESEEVHILRDDVRRGMLVTFKWKPKKSGLTEEFRESIIALNKQDLAKEFKGEWK